jgi:4-hydroxy-2-oxoheptanedioate aldolase
MQMPKNKVKELWRAGKPVVTGWCTTPDPYVAEAMARAGFDTLVLDMQHGMAIGPDRAAVWLQVVGQQDVTPIVRIPWNEPAFAQWVLDAGAMGIIIPMVNNTEEARKAIGACRYPPLGYRSYGPNRARFFEPDYFPHANQEILCLPMMETVEGIEHVEEIAQLPGIDGFWIGPSDLAVSMGLPPKQYRDDPRHAAAVQRVIDVAKKYGLNAGIWAASPEDGLRRWKQGFNLNPICNDVFQVRFGAERAVSEFRAQLEQ